MRVLVACESSGTVRDAFIRAGHDALSCDLLPTERPGPHYQGDVRDVLHAPWDLMIAHPPCTHISVSGSRYFAAKRMDGRQPAGISFFMELWRHGERYIEHVAAEQPIGVLSSLFRAPDQIIQPYHFGHDASKSTCLWLRNLPPLRPTAFVEPRLIAGRPRWANQTDSGQNKLTPSPDRWKERSATYEGVARAMAEQWGAFILERIAA